MRICNSLIYSLFIIFIGHHSLAIEVPENCIQEEKAPCVVKDLKNFSVGGHLFKPSKETLMKILTFNPLKVELIYGTFRIQISSKREISIDQLKHKLKDVVYYKKNPQGYNVMKSSDLDFMTLVRSKTGTQDYIVDKYELLNKKEFAQFISHFYSSKSEYESDLKNLSVLYKSKLELESKNENEVLQSSLSRKIASEEAEERKRERDLLKIKTEREKTRQQFFQRTFQQ